MYVGSDPASGLLIGSISGAISDSKMGLDAAGHSGGFWNQHNAAFKRLQRTRKNLYKLYPFTVLAL